MGTLTDKIRGARGALLGAVGVAFAQSWLPLVGLIADGYRADFDFGVLVGPMWFGTAVGLLVAYAGWFLTGKYAGRQGGRRASLECRAGLALACTLIGCMGLAATRGAGSWDGPFTLAWQVAVFAVSSVTAFGGGALTCVWAGGHHSERVSEKGAPSSSADVVLGGLAFSLVLTVQCALAAWLGSNIWAPCITGVFAVISYALLVAGVSGAECVTTPADGGDTRSIRKAGRPLLAGVLLGFTVSLMIGQFLGCGNGTADPNTWMFGLLGVVFGAIAQIAVRRLRGAWDPFVTCWVVASLFVVAFYPMNAGSDFSLKFALAATTLALWSAVAVLPSTLSAFALRDGCRPAVCCLAFVVGLIAAGTLGGPLGYLVAGSAFESSFVLVSGVSSMVLGFVSLTLVLNRPLRFRHDGADGASDMEEGAAGDAVVSADDVPDEIDALASNCVLIADACGLTPRERDVLAVLARGYDVARVQEELGISEGTALTHKRHIYQKLDVHTRAELLDRVRQG